MKSIASNKTQFSANQNMLLVSNAVDLADSPERAELKEVLRGNDRSIVRDDLINAMEGFQQRKATVIADSTRELFDKIDPKPHGVISDTAAWIHSGKLHPHDLAALKATETLSQTSAIVDESLAKATGSSSRISTTDLVKAARNMDLAADGFVSVMQHRQQEVSVFDSGPHTHRSHRVDADVNIHATNGARTHLRVQRQRAGKAK